jgi:hypothetical protein
MNVGIFISGVPLYNPLYKKIYVEKILFLKKTSSASLLARHRHRDGHTLAWNLEIA